MSLCKGYISKKLKIMNVCGALRDLVPFVQIKNVKNTHEGVLLLVSKVAG